MNEIEPRLLLLPEVNNGEQFDVFDLCAAYWYHFTPPVKEGKWYLHRVNLCNDQIEKVLEGQAGTAESKIRERFQLIQDARYQPNYQAIRIVVPEFPESGYNIDTEAFNWIKLVRQYSSLCSLESSDTADVQEGGLLASNRRLAVSKDLDFQGPLAASQPFSELELRIREIVHLELRETLQELIASPLTHFSEKSLHVRFASRLLQHPELSTPVSSGVADRFQRELNQVQRISNRSLSNYHARAYSVPPLQLEYGNNLSGAYRTDLVILSPLEIKDIAIPMSLQNGQGKYLKPLIGVEFGTEKTGWRSMYEHFKNDQLKLAECHLGYSVSVMRNLTVCSEGTATWMRKDNQIQQFKQTFQEYVARFPNVHWIALVLHIAHGYVDCFDPKTGWLRLDSLELAPIKDFLARILP